MTTTFAIPTDTEVITHTLMLEGEDGDAGRRGRKKVIAKSECRFDCPNDDILATCIEQIRLSDEHLKSRPEEMALWDWQRTFIESNSLKPRKSGGVVILGVAWYDEQFFDEKRNAYANPSHLEKYLNIGLHEEAITVTHWKLMPDN